MGYDLRQNGEGLEYESSTWFSDAESCSSDSEGEAISDQNQSCRNSDASWSGAVYDFSSLMAQLPNSNKRGGLSKYYDGKSQSFTSLSDAKCIEDLRKKENPYIKRKMKSCKSYADGLCDKDQNGFCTHSPNNKDFAKKPSRASCGNLMARNNGSNLFCRPPGIPLNKNSTRLS